MKQKRKLGKKVLSFLLSLALVLGLMPAMSMTAWADDPVFYTLDGTTYVNQSSYVGVSDVSLNEVNWKVNGNTQTSEYNNVPYWRIGGGKNESLEGVERPVYSVDKLKANVSKVELAVGSMSTEGFSVNSIKLIVASDAGFSSVIEQKTITGIQAGSTHTFTPGQGKTWSDAYYKFLFNISASRGSNKFIEFKSAKFYGASTGGGDSTHTHTWATEWTNDATYHWHACTGEGSTDDCLDETEASKAEHTYGNTGDARFTCTVCGYVDTTKQTEAEAADLAAAKTDAKADLDTLLQGKKQSDYDADDWATLTQAIADGKTAIDNATTTEGVATAKSNVETVAKAVKTKAEKKEEADTTAAIGVSGTINALPAADKVTTTDKDAIEAARKAYEGLTADQKKKVDAATLKKLTDAEASLKKAVEAAEKAAKDAKAAAEKEDADKAAAKTATDKIAALPVADQVKTTDKAAIEAARKAYNALTEDQKKKVDAATLKKLTDAESALNDLAKEEVKEIKDSDKGTFEVVSAPTDTKQTGTVIFKLVSDKKAEKAVVPAFVTNNGKKYKVVSVAPNAFSGSKATKVVIGKNVKTISPKAFNKSMVERIIVKTKKLSKRSVKNSLKGCKAKKITVKVKIGEKKVNQKYVKKYRKYFTAKNAGKKATVK